MNSARLSFSSNGCHLNGTLVLPEGGAERALAMALLIPGSGPVDRDENMPRFPLDVLRQLSVKLAERNIASFRYDKRGVGASQGEFLRAGFWDNAHDAQAALDMLFRHEATRQAPLFVLGHSEGAVIAAYLTARPSAVLRGAVLLAGTARSGEELLLWQSKRIAATMKGLNKLLVKLLRMDVTSRQKRRLDAIKASSGDTMRMHWIVKLNAKWLREFMAYDPLTDLVRAKVPILAITGDKDLQVDPGDIETMRQAVPTAFEGRVMSDLNHILRHEPEAPSLSHYRAQLGKPIDARVVTAVADWITRAASFPANSPAPKNTSGSGTSTVASCS